jgi:predicted metal-dependent peptidase
MSTTPTPTSKPSPETSAKAAELIAQAKTALVLDHCFFSCLLLQMPTVEDNSIPSCTTNGVIIKYNPSFIETLTPAQVQGLLVHEIMHPAFGHLWRLPRDKDGNEAGDYAINAFIDNYNRSGTSRKLELPPNALLDHKYDESSVEQILTEIRQQKQKQQPPPSGGGGGNGKSKSDGSDQGDGGGTGWGDFEDPTASGDGENDMDEQDMQKEWERRVVQAATADKMQRGTLPGCIQALIDSIVDHKVPWQQLLERFIDQTSATDYSWRKPDRRFLPDDIIIPDLHDETLGEIVIAIDTSGSIYGVPQVLSSFEAEINALILRCKPEKVTIIHCDADIQHVEYLGSGETFNLKPKGGGGTRFEPVGEYILKHNINPRVCIYLTDLYGSFPSTPWPFPTIWAVYQNETGEAPFGETIHIPKEG